MAVRDISELQARYTCDEADLFLNISGNLFCRRIGGDTAKLVSERIPRVLQNWTRISLNDSDTSISKSLQLDNPVNQATIACLSFGEFVGMVADDPGEKLVMKAFHVLLKREEKTSKGEMADKAEKLPIVRTIEAGEVQRNYLQVKADVKGLVDTEMNRMMGDSDLIGLMVGKGRED